MYANRLGEFVIAEAAENWVYTIRYNERPPIHVRGALNPWQTERQRIVWKAEQAAWVKIKAYQADYRRTEDKMKRDIERYNKALKELELLTGQSIGTGPIGTYAGMALAVIPGFGWAAAAFSMISQLVGMLSGTKRRIKGLIAELERLTAQLNISKRRLQTLAQNIIHESGAGERVQQAQAVMVQRDLTVAQTEYAYKQQQLIQRQERYQAELNAARQVSPTRVVYREEGDL